MNKDNKNTIAKQIFEFCGSLLKYELFINYKDFNNKKCKGYLIEDKLMEEFKKNIFYDELKDDLKEYINQTFDDKIEEKIKKLCKSKEIKKITQKKFITIEQFKTILDKHKFYLINYELWSNICQDDKKNRRTSQRRRHINFHAGQYRARRKSRRDFRR